MKLNRRNLVMLSLAVVAGSCLVGLTQLNAQSFGAKKAVPTKVAVCHIGDLFERYQRAKDLLETLNKKRQEFLSEGQKRVTKLEDLRQQLSGYLEGKPEYKKLFDQIQRNTIELEVWKQMQQAKLMAEHMAMTKNIYRQINDAIAEVAKERGVDLVVQFDPREIDAKNAQEWQMQVQMRQVLYSSPELDITADVLQKLDETYRVSRPN